MKLRSEKWIHGFFAELILFGVVFTVVSALRSYVDLVPLYPKPILFAGLGCVPQSVPIVPVRYYGFPEPWLFTSWEFRGYGYPLRGGGWFSRYNFHVRGFVVDVFFHALLFFPVLLMMRWISWDKQRALQRLPND